MASRVILRAARAADLPTIRELITTEFILSEPASVHLRDTKAGFTKLYDRFALHLDLNTTIVAEEVHKGDDPGKMVSCHVTVPLSADVNLDGITNQIPVLSLLDELHAPLGEVLKRKAIPESRVLHSLFGATRKEYHGMGLYKRIIDTLMQQVVKDDRWDLAVSECTSPVTRHIKKNTFAWTEENFIKYADFSMAGQKPFAGLEGGVALLLKDFRGVKGTL